MGIYQPKMILVKVKITFKGRYSLCLPKLKSIPILLYDISTKNKIVLLSLLLLKSCLA